VVVLAVCYSSALTVWPLVAATAVVGILALARSSAWVPTAALLAGGVVLWVLLAAAGVEPALAGVATGLLVPGARAGAPGDPAAVLERRVAPWSAFVVLPVFALANAGITFHAGMLAGPGAASVFWGVTAARVAGKAVGIPLAALAVVRLGWGRLPDGLRWRHVVGGAAVAGIGFTVPLLVAERAFPHDVALVTAAELGLFAGSAAAVALGAVVLLSVSRAAGARPAVAPARPEPTDEDGRPLPW